MPKQKRRKRPQDLNGSSLQNGQQRLTPGQFKEYDYTKPTPAEPLAEQPAVIFRHPDLAPLTLTGLRDALKLNSIHLTSEMDGSYDCNVSANGLSRVINPYDGAEVLQFFKDALNHISVTR